MQTKRGLIVAGVFLFSLFAFGASSQTVAAQSADDGRESITLSPTSIKLQIDAGKTATGKLTVVNDGAIGYDFLVYARPYSIVDNAYDNPDFTNVTKYSDLYGWVQFPKTSYRIEAGATLEIDYKITVPSGAAPGGHYGVVFAETQPDDSADGGNAVIRKKRVGTIAYVTVNGQYKNEGEAAKGSIDFWQLQPPLRATVIAKNTGNTDFTSTTRLTVRDMFGSKKYESVKEFQVLPETTRTMPLEWTNSPWFGLFKIETEQKFLDKTDTSEGYVLMMPRYMPIAFIVIIIIGGIFYVWRRKHRR